MSLWLLIVFSCQPVAEEDNPPQSPPAITTKSGVEMILIPAGSFIMGDANGPADAQPAHPLSISSFYMDKYEVTQGDYTKITGTNPSKLAGKDWQTYPVNGVDWLQAARYCNDRSRLEGLTPCYDEKTFHCNFEADGYRLPTEAEWEYAYRAGSTDSYYFGSNANGQLARYAWFKENSQRQPQPVGGKKSNTWGLHDMAGNVAEWCNDFYDTDYYQNSLARDPCGPPAGDKKVLRGGSWSDAADACSAAVRLSDLSGFGDTCLGNPAYGFRCVRKYFASEK
ncbi:MAG: hypothetical protein AMJ79_11290 [Phycisphaerae bacterium SM23_30]|nr:MAG: hypothetical protein AMJ79_11290 [Phycisphaerae bacterium SM23_30]